MAMSIEKLNQKLEKVLKNLDKAIEDRELSKAQTAIESAKSLNEKSEGQQNDAILNELEERIKKITEEIKEDDDELEAKEIKDLTAIREEIEKGSNPFKNIKAVVDSLEKKDFSQEDLKQYKESQKNDNLAQIEGIKLKNQEVASVIIDIENRYIEKIDNNYAVIEIIKNIKEKKAKLDSLVKGKDDEAIQKTKSDIKAKISEMGAKGVDVSSIQNFESDPSIIDGFVTKKETELRTESDNLAVVAASDLAIPESYRLQYDFANIKSSEDLKDRYQQMVGTRQKNSLKITTLEAENRQIDETIKTLEKEEKIKNIAYNKDGSPKSDSEIEKAVLSNDSTRQNIEKLVSDRFDSNNPFKRFGARMDYYKETQEIGRVKAFWKALTNKTKNVKRIAETSMAVQTGIGMTNKAINNMAKRQNDFKETIRKEAAKKMSKNPKLTENEIKDEVIKKAYEEASKDDDNAR